MDPITIIGLPILAKNLIELGQTLNAARQRWRSAERDFIELGQDVNAYMLLLQEIEMDVRLRPPTMPRLYQLKHLVTLTNSAVYEANSILIGIQQSPWILARAKMAFGSQQPQLRELIGKLGYRTQVIVNQVQIYNSQRIWSEMSILSQQCVALLDRTGRIETRVSSIEDQMATMQHSMNRLLSAQEAHKSEIMGRLDDISNKGTSTPPPSYSINDDTSHPAKSSISVSISPAAGSQATKRVESCNMKDWNSMKDVRAILRGMTPYWFVDPEHEKNGTENRTRVYIHPDLKVRDVRLALQDQLSHPLTGRLAHKGTVLDEDAVWSSYSIPTGDDISLVSISWVIDELVSRKLGRGWQRA